MKKKFAALLLVTVSALTLTACVSDSTPVGNSKGFTSEIVTVGGDMFDCTFENRGWKSGAMSCVDLQKKAPVGAGDTKEFTRAIVTVGAKQLDCIFENRTWQRGTMDCFPAKN